MCGPLQDPQKVAQDLKLKSTIRDKKRQDLDAHVTLWAHQKWFTISK